MKSRTQEILPAKHRSSISKRLYMFFYIAFWFLLPNAFSTNKSQVYLLHQVLFPIFPIVSYNERKRTLDILVFSFSPPSTRKENALLPTPACCLKPENWIFVLQLEKWRHRQRPCPASLLRTVAEQEIQSSGSQTCSTEEGGKTGVVTQPFSSCFGVLVTGVIRQATYAVFR